MIFSHSLTLPGKSYLQSSSKASGLIPVTGFLYVVAYFLIKNGTRCSKVFCSLSQGRNVYGDDVDSIVEVAAKAACGNFLLQIPVGGTNHPYIYQHRVPADLSHFTVLQKPQQFGLEPQIHLPDLVQKQGPSARFADYSRLVTYRSCKGTLFVAEQLCLQQSFRQGSAVNRNKGLVTPIA
jgi:hypothetical protein